MASRRRALLLIAFLSQITVAEDLLAKRTLFATARDRKGHVLYLEKHTLYYNAAGEIQSAHTYYERESGEVIATLTSDFQNSLATPEHTAENKLTGDRYGVRRHGHGLQMFKQDGDEKEEKTKDLENGFSGDSLVVAGQGINYYVQRNLEKIISEKSTKLTLLIPGRLQYFSFRMESIEQKEGVLFLEFTASNFLIRLFVPKIKVQFDLKERRMIRYEGVSNVADLDGKIREVIIHYEYL